MFAIYNNGTVGFRSTSDNLYALKNVEELESARFEPKEGLIQNFSNELNKEKKELEVLEARLNSLITVDQRREMELAEIEKELN